MIFVKAIDVANPEILLFNSTIINVTYKNFFFYSKLVCSVSQPVLSLDQIFLRAFRVGGEAGQTLGTRKRIQQKERDKRSLRESIVISSYSRVLHMWIKSIGKKSYIVNDVYYVVRPMVVASVLNTDFFLVIVP